MPSSLEAYSLNQSRGRGSCDEDLHADSGTLNLRCGPVRGPPKGSTTREAGPGEPLGEHTSHSEILGDSVLTQPSYGSRDGRYPSCMIVAVLSNAAEVLQKGPPGPQSVMTTGAAGVP